VLIILSDVLCSFNVLRSLALLRNKTGGF